MTIRYQHAVVIGGSMAGLLAAARIAPLCERVTLIERDQYPTDASGRKGVPQGRHAHILLMRGRELLEESFPGIVRELEDAGAQRVAWFRDTLWCGPFGHGALSDSDDIIHTCTRPLIDWAVRNRVFAIPNLTVRERCDVVALQQSFEQRMTGVVVRARDSGEEAPLAADLVIDASGRESRGPEWLAELGYQRPEETTIDSRLAYATRFYERPPEGTFDWRMVFVQSDPPRDTRGGIVMPVENGRWLVTLVGILGDHPPTDEDGYTAFAHSLAVPHIANAIGAARPLGPIAGYARTANRQRHFERIRVPEGFFAVGDAVFALNPVYGQGMTVAAMGARLLGKHLARGGGSNAFHRRLARQNAIPWMMATSEDVRSLAEASARPSPITRALQTYLWRVVEASCRDPRVYQYFTRVIHMRSSPALLFHPRIALRVATMARR